MNEQEYTKLLCVIDDYLGGEPLIIKWANGLSTKCVSDFGINESSMEPEDEDYIGEFYTVVKVIETLQPGSDDSISIYNDYIEVSLKNIPRKIALEDGTVLWERKA